jgi:hypothetical protein
VVRDPIRADHPESDILPAAPLDPPRRALPDRVGIQQQRDHHPRVERRPTPTVAPVHGIERAQIDRVYRIEHKPGQMILSQPLAQARRQQKLLITVAGHEVERHCSLLPPEEHLTSSSDPDRIDQPGLCDSLKSA